MRLCSKHFTLSSHMSFTKHVMNKIRLYFSCCYETCWAADDYRKTNDRDFVGNPLFTETVMLDNSHTFNSKHSSSLCCACWISYYLIIIQSAKTHWDDQLSLPAATPSAETPNYHGWNSLLPSMWSTKCVPSWLRGWQKAAGQMCWLLDKLSMLEVSLQTLVQFQAVSQPAVIGRPTGLRKIGPASSGLGFGRGRPSL